jgi:hypothetical protein
MALKNPDITEHNNPDLAAMDSDFVRGGQRSTDNLSTLLTDFVDKSDQLKEGVTKVYVKSEGVDYRLLSIANVGLITGWEEVSGVSTFGDLEGDPDDNAALAAKFLALLDAISTEVLDRQNADEAYLILAKAYTDLVSTDVLRWAGNWDASLGTYPTSGTGTSGGIRRGDCYDISVAGIIDGNEYEVGDQLRARVANPGQVTANWGTGQTNTQQATTTKIGIARMATSSEAIAALNALLMSNPVTVKAQIGDEKKSYIKECYVLSVMEIIFPMELAGQFTALSCSTAMSNLQYKIGAAGTYTTFSTPVSYAAGAEIYLKWDYTSPTEQRGWIRMKGKDN